MIYPNFFVIGAPKCGTSSLAAWLAQHPEIYMSPVKEPQYFSTDIPIPHYHSRSGYFDLFEKAGPEHSAIGEASAMYLLSKTAVPQIKEKIPNARFIVLLRNPLEMAPSFHSQLVFDSYENIVSFDEAWSLQYSRAEGFHIPAQCPAPMLLQYKLVCSLGDQIKRLYQNVEKSQVLVLFLEDMRRNPMTVWEECLDFLGVSSFVDVRFEKKNRAKRWRFRSVGALQRTYLSMQKKMGGGPVGIGAFRLLNNLSVKEEKRKPLSPDTLRLLSKEFYEDVMLLSDITGRDLQSWVGYDEGCGSNLI